MTSPSAMGIQSPPELLAQVRDAFETSAICDVAEWCLDELATRLA